MDQTELLFHDHAARPLPRDVWAVHVFPYLSMRDCKALRQVSRALAAAGWTYFTDGEGAWKSLGAGSDEIAFSFAYERAQEFRKWKIVWTQGAGMASYLLPQSCSVRSLKQIHLSSMNHAAVTASIWIGGERVEQFCNTRVVSAELGSGFLTSSDEPTRLCFSFPAVQCLIVRAEWDMFGDRDGPHFCAATKHVLQSLLERCGPGLETLVMDLPLSFKSWIEGNGVEVGIHQEIARWTMSPKGDCRIRADKSDPDCSIQLQVRYHATRKEYDPPIHDMWMCNAIATFVGAIFAGALLIAIWCSAV